MPEIPGSNSVPGGSSPGRGAVPARPIGVGSSGAAGGAAPVSTGGALDAQSAKQLPRYFGFHTEASIMARLAGMGISPTLGNLRIAQQMLRYGLGLDAGEINQIAQLWSQVGPNDVVKLEAIVLL